MMWPGAAGAQAPGLQLVVEQPAAGSDVRGTVVVGGWAVDNSGGSGTGVAPGSVQIWLGPAGTGQLLATAGYGDPRPDLVPRFGNVRYLPSGFRYFWNTCEAPPGPNTLTVTARSSVVANRTATVTVPVDVGGCALQMGETTTGQALTSNQQDAWTFEGTAGERVAITLDAVGRWDTLLELIGPDGSREDIDDDGGMDLNSWLSRPLRETGTYTLLARPLSSEGCTGDYVVLAWLGAPGTSDPNEAAGILGTTALFNFRGTIREFGERQTWSFDASQGEELILYVPRNVGSRLDPFVELLAPDGQVLARDDDGGGGLNSFVQGVLPQGGTYRLVTQSVRDDCGGEYLLRIEPDWGEQSGLRGAIPFDQTVSGSLSTGVRRDVWTFPAVAGERLTLALEPGGPARVQVAAPSGEWELARSTRGRPLGLSFEPRQTGTYQAVVFDDTSRPIDYSLTLERGFGRLIANKGPVPLSQAVPGEIQFAEGRDLYTFDGRQGQQVRITLDRPGRSQLDPYLELQEPDGRTLAEDDDSGGELNSLIQLTLPRDGRYTIVARGLADSAGPYVLTVNLTGEGEGARPATGPTPTPTSPAPGPSPTPSRGPAPSTPPR
jgi:hypothetical protein